MVIDAIVSVFFAIVNSVLGLFPTIAFTDEGSSGGVWTPPALAHYGNQMNYFFPLNTLLTCLTLTLGLRTALFLFDGGVWIFHQIHGSD